MNVHFCVHEDWVLRVCTWGVSTYFQLLFFHLGRKKLTPGGLWDSSNHKVKQCLTYPQILKPLPILMRSPPKCYCNVCIGILSVMEIEPCISTPCFEGFLHLIYHIFLRQLWWPVSNTLTESVLGELFWNMVLLTF